MKQTIFINELPPGLNGSNGLQQLHWAKYNKLKKEWVWLIKAENPDTHNGAVKVNYTRVSTNPMDLDNCAASFKVVGDGLVGCGVIEDDSPDILQELNVKWEKTSTKDNQGVRVVIEDVET